MGKLSELSKPVAYDYQIASACIADGDDKKWVDWNNKLTHECPPDWMVEDGKVTGIKPLYSQEYVSALIQRAERIDSMLTESVQALKVAEKLNADAEARGVEKLAAAFKSWASDETFPDYEAQRHWATASQEALSFAGDLRNGSCDDR
ncbi:hypothetical protein JY469_21710 [Serratia marcescens]|nr:hypothetical protein [Serratia marcescens]